MYQTFLFPLRAPRGWSETPPTVDIAANTPYKVSTLQFYDPTGTATTTTVTGSTPVNGFIFDGIVTFVNSGQLTDGTFTIDPVTGTQLATAGQTVINGGNIQADSISLGKLVNVTESTGFMDFNSESITIGTTSSGVDTIRVRLGKLS